MKNKGFTLIELLAVIVILAIIALIATPIVLNIISDARDSSNERSVELYGAAVEQGIARTLLTQEVPSGQYESSNDGKTISKGSVTIKVDYSGNKVKCSTVMISEQGTVSLYGCLVGSDTKKYTYGKYQQVFKPQYYIFDSLGTVGITNAPASPSTERPTGKSFYLGYDVADGKVSVGYVCFVRNGNEYCLKGYDKDAYKTNQAIIADAFEEVLDTDVCSFNELEEFSQCDIDGLNVIANSMGAIMVNNSTNSMCVVTAARAIICRVFDS